jgi:hypothetical protein
MAMVLEESESLAKTKNFGEDIICKFWAELEYILQNIYKKFANVLKFCYDAKKAQVISLN